MSHNIYLITGSGELCHYGIKGMRWGVRRTPEQLGHKNLKRARTSNMTKWGSDPDHNVAYVSGYSGSGKSTAANSLVNANTDAIHLDLYFEGDGTLLSIGDDHRNANFDRFLTKNGIKAPNEVPRKDWARYDTLPKFEEAIESFGREQYANGRRVVAEGIQILDDSVRPDKTFFSDKPLVLLTTNPVSSAKRAFKRDGRGGLIKGLGDIDGVVSYVNWYADSKHRINELSSSANAKRGEDWVKNYLRSV